MIKSPSPSLHARLSGFSRAVTHGLWRWRTAWVSAVVVCASALLWSGLAPTPTGGTQIVVSRGDLPVGTVLTREHLSTRTVDVAATVLGPAPTLDQALGATLSVSLRSGSLVRSSDLVEASLFEHTPPGLVFTVVTIQNAGIIGYLQPGMHVDLLEVDSTGAGPAPVLAAGALIVSLNPPNPANGEFTSSDLDQPWSQSVSGDNFSSTVLVATTRTDSTALARGSQWQGVHAVIVAQ